MITFFIVGYVFPALLGFTMWAALLKLTGALDVKPLLVGLVIALLPYINLAGVGTMIVMLWCELLRD